MNFSHKLKEGWYSYKGLYIDKKYPTIVYAPGRVGSIGLHKNLRDAGIFSFKTEFFNASRLGSTKFVYDHIINKQKPAKVITLVRDPVALMASYFFSKVNFGWLGEGLSTENEKDIPKLQKSFVDEVLKTKRLDQHLYWFENEFEKYLKINVFSYTFNTDKMYSLIPNPSYPTLIIKTELNDESKGEVIAEFLNIPNLNITRENTRSSKPDGNTYNKFKDAISIPEEILENIYDSNYATHFFSPEERTTLKKKWS